MAMRLSREWIEFIEGGVSIAVGSRDAANRPDCVRGLGALVSGDGTVVQVNLFASLAARTRENAEQTGCVAVTFGRVSDARAIQLKGRVDRVRDGEERDRSLSGIYIGAYSEQLAQVGLPRGLIRRLRVWPLVVVEFAPIEMFVQTPGPGAGRRVPAA